MNRHGITVVTCGFDDKDAMIGSKLNRRLIFSSGIFNIDSLDQR
ncbi:Uncharacterised protein [Mycobacteroides abscessus subsp. abscessus]|nr:Uncharacterised protein [Mycobacteroides abscessus subsp. abscessus]